MKRFTLIAALFALACAAIAAEPSAAALLTKARAEAKQEGKNVFVIFHASWCGWCHRLDETFLADKTMGKLMDDNFVVVHIDVLEQPAKKELENAGGEDLLKQWNGDKGGIPFMVVLSPEGDKLADSNQTGENGSNIGYPAKPEEIAHFMKMLKTAPRLTSAQAGQIQTWLTAHAPKS